MRRLLFLIIAAALMWSGYWFFGANALKSSTHIWFEDRRAEGWLAEADDIRVRGFPNRFDTTFDQIALADPATGWAWTAPFFQLLTLSYQPNHVIAVWPNDQKVSTPFENFTLQSERMQASVVVSDPSSLMLQRSNLVADQLRISTDTAEVTQLRALNFALRQLADPLQYQIAVTASDLAPAAELRALVDRAGELPQSFSALRADMTIGFDRIWDRETIEVARPQPTSAKLTLAEAKWGDLSLAAAGDLTIDPQGRANGRITVKARNWRDILQMSIDAGAVSPGLGRQIEGGLQTLANMSGNAETLDLPIDFRNGFMFVSIIPIGPAPNFSMR